jgi:hypothetical protein
VLVEGVDQVKDCDFGWCRGNRPTIPNPLRDDGVVSLATGGGDVLAQQHVSTIDMNDGLRAKAEDFGFARILRAALLIVSRFVTLTIGPIYESSGGRTRTYNQPVNSRLLYH